MTTANSSVVNNVAIVGNGNITYSSSNSSIARVNSTTGVVTILKTGNVTISASEVSTDEYTSASDSYTLRISSAATAPTTVATTVANGGTGLTSLASGNIPFGNGTSAFSSSAALNWNGTYLFVGGGTALGGATNPILATTGSANNYVQSYVRNSQAGTSSSGDLVAYADNSTDSHGWADMGFTSSTYASTDYSVTGPNEAYVLGSAPANASDTGTLGEIRIDDSFIYVCTATNTWKRASLTSTF